MISAGEWVQAAGTWTNDRTHGLQFRAAFLKATAPTTLDGIEKHLASGMIRGIGPAYAKRLVKAFGEAVFDVIEADPSRLREVEGIGPVRAARIAAGWAEQKVVREIMLFLHAHGVGASRAVRIFKTYGAEAVATITEKAKRVQCDEIWRFTYAKAKNVAEAKAAPDGAADTWTWTAIGADSKLIVTNAFSKKFENHAHMVALYAVCHNFVWVHKSLRASPAMAAGLSDRLWSMEDLTALAEAADAKLVKRAPYQSVWNGL